MGSGAKFWSIFKPRVKAYPVVPVGPFMFLCFCLFCSVVVFSSCYESLLYSVLREVETINIRFKKGTEEYNNKMKDALQVFVPNDFRSTDYGDTVSQVSDL